MGRRKELGAQGDAVVSGGLGPAMACWKESGRGANFLGYKIGAEC